MPGVATLRKCPFHDCNRRLPNEVFACRKHWFGMNLAERDAILSAWRAYKNGSIGIDTLRGTQQRILGTRGTA